MARGLTNTANTGEPLSGNQDLGEVINEAYAKAGPYHHQIEDLPLYQVKAKKWGSTTALLTLIYRRSWTHWGLEVDARDLSHWEGAYESMPIWKDPIDASGQPAWSVHGLPDGVLVEKVPDYEHDQNHMPRHRMWSRPVERVLVPFSLWHNPVPRLDKYQQTINANFVQFGSMYFYPNTLRYDYATLIQTPVGNNIFSSGNKTLSHGYYTFTATPRGFYQHIPRWSATLNKWVVDEALEYEEKEWDGNAFRTY
jgi:hypothetical protein